MKNKKFIVIVLFLVLLGSGLLIYYNKFMNNEKGEETLSKEYTFNNEYGEFSIAADKALKCRGTAGASNNVFYIVAGNLYLYSETSINELYAMNVDDIYYEEEQGDIIVVDTNSDTLIIKESSYLKYLEDEVSDEIYEEFNFDIAHGLVTIKADKAIQVKTAEGMAEVIYYLKDSNLYYYVIEGEDKLYATGVKDMFFANNSGELLTVVLDEGSNIVENSIYLSYVSIALRQFVFETANGQVKINAHKALACQGWSGASNNIFYMIDGNLYLYSGNMVNMLYAKNVGNIYYESEQSEVITVTTNKDTIIIKESSHLNYEKSSSNKKYNEYTFNTAYGVVTINAYKALACQGWSGASNTIFFIRDNNLYKLMYEGAHELYAKNVKDIYFETVQTDKLTVLINKDTVILKEEVYLNYLNNEVSDDTNDKAYEEFNFDIAHGPVNIKADKAIQVKTAEGMAEVIYYLKDSNLYYYVIEGEDELYATGVKDIFYANNSGELLTVVLDEGSNIVENSIYLSYVSIELRQFVFETANGQVKINAHEALACQGWAGASNSIFYMIDGNLYLYIDSSTNELYAKNIGNIYYETKQSEVITVTTNKDTVIVKESKCLEYK